MIEGTTYATIEECENDAVRLYPSPAHAILLKKKEEGRWQLYCQLAGVTKHDPHARFTLAGLQKCDCKWSISVSLVKVGDGRKCRVSKVNAIHTNHEVVVGANANPNLITKRDVKQSEEAVNDEIVTIANSTLLPLLVPLHQECPEEGEPAREGTHGRR